jgi:hypothetical protein
MLKSIIGNDGNKYPPELRANACSLVGTLLRNLDYDKTLKASLGSEYQGILKAVAEEQGVPEKLAQAVKWARESLP